MYSDALCNESCPIREWVVPTHVNATCHTHPTWHDSFIYVSHTWVLHTGWRRLIGSPKLQIIFHKRATNYRALLRKMTYRDKGSYESSPPCITRTHARESRLEGYTLQWVIPQTCWCDATQVTASRHQSPWTRFATIAIHSATSYAPYLIHEWVVPHIWMRHVTRTHAPR